MTPKQMHYETLAGTIIEKMKKRNMDACYCTTVEEAEKLASPNQIVPSLSAVP